MFRVWTSDEYLECCANTTEELIKYLAYIGVLINQIIKIDKY